VAIKDGDAFGEDWGRLAEAGKTPKSTRRRRPLRSSPGWIDMMVFNPGGGAP